jgi:hypothetical protein
VKYKPLSRCVCVIALAAGFYLCGITALAAEEGSPDLQSTAPEIRDTVPAAAAEAKTGRIASPPETEKNESAELYPADVQTIIDGDTRQIVKTYILVPGQSPEDIPRDAFERGGWSYTLTDVTENRVTGADVKAHTETVTLNTDTKDPDAIIPQLAPTLDYRSEDGYIGTLTLDLSTVKCEEAGYKNSSYTVTATREYPHLSGPDLSLIPKTITENGRTLTLEDVSWEAQNIVNVDYDELPSSYRAVAKYTAGASKTVVTGYVTTADYVGEVAKTVTGDTVYTAYFEGKEINPSLKPTETPKPTDAPGSSGASDSQSGGEIPFIPIAIGLTVLALLGGAGAFWFRRRNVRIYRDHFRVLAAKDRITAKAPLIDLSPLDGECFGLVIDRPAAKALNGVTIEVRRGAATLEHRIACEGNAYKIEADFAAGTIQAIY